MRSVKAMTSSVFMMLSLAAAALANAQHSCTVPDALVAGVLGGLDRMVLGHPKSGPLVMGIADRGDIVLVHLPSVVVTLGGTAHEMEGLFRYLPNHVRKWDGGAMAARANQRADMIATHQFEAACQEPQPPRPAHPGQEQGLIAVMPRSDQARMDAVKQKFPECAMRPEPPFPQLCAAAPREAFCRVVRDWKDVPVYRRLPPSPDSPLKRSIMQAIVNSVARDMLADPGRNEILAEDFNVDDEGVSGVVVRGNRIVWRFGARIDKDDPCLAQAGVYNGGCAPCPPEAFRISPAQRRKMLRLYPLSR